MDKGYVPFFSSTVDTFTLGRLRSLLVQLSSCGLCSFILVFNPLNPELNPICYLLALLGAYHFLHVSRIRVKSLTFRRLMSYIYMEHPFLMFLDHTQRRSTVGRAPLDEWSAGRRDLYLTTHDTHNRQISIPPVGFEPTISAGERPVHSTGRSLTDSDDIRCCIDTIWPPEDEQDIARKMYV